MLSTALLAYNEFSLKDMISRFSEAGHILGLTVCSSDTKVVHEPISNIIADELSIYNGDARWKSVQKFK